MAYTLAQRADLLEHRPFLKRIQLAISEAAVAITTEDPETPNHAERITQAGQVLRSPGAWAEVMVNGILASDNIGNGGTDDPIDSDSALAWVVSSLWDSYALSAR